MNEFFLANSENLISLKLTPSPQIWDANKAESLLMFYMITSRLSGYAIGKSRTLVLGTRYPFQIFQEVWNFDAVHSIQDQSDFPTRIGRRSTEATCCWFLLSVVISLYIFISLFIESSLYIEKDTDINVTVYKCTFVAFAVFFFFQKLLQMLSKDLFQIAVNNYADAFIFMS